MRHEKCSESKRKWDRTREYLWVCLSENEFTFSSMLHTHTHNNEICSSLPFSPPLIRASCGLQITAWLEVCWYIQPHRHTSQVDNPDPLHGSVQNWQWNIFLGRLDNFTWFWFYYLSFCLFVAFLSLLMFCYFFFLLPGYLGFLEMQNLESCSNVIL